LAGLKDLNNVWNNVKEIDLRPLAEAAQKSLHIALVGRDEAALASLAQAMRRDPSRPDQVTQSPLLLVHLGDSQAGDDLNQTSRADLIVLSLQVADEEASRERELAKSWANAGKAVLVILPPEDPGQPSNALSQWVTWDKRQVIHGALVDAHFLAETFVPAVMRLLPGQLLPLGRQFPLFRTAVAYELINETCFSNTAYALSTGVAEIIPIFDIPLNIADMFVLTKAQAFLVYRLGLALGLSIQWRDYVAEFGGVLGGGFLWRQVARSLIGLIPAWGIIPKMAVSYAGTYVVGHAVYRWYLTGRHVTSAQMKQLYAQAFARGKHLAQNLRQKLPKRKAKALELPAAGQSIATASQPGRRSFISRRSKGKQCSKCGKTSAKDAQFCQYCGQSLQPS